MNLSDDKCIFFVPNLLKHSRKGVHQAPIELIAFPVNRSLCIVYLLQIYIKRTSELRREGTKITYQLAKVPQSKDKITRWIKLVLERSGIDVSVHTAHSTRAASTSYATNIGVSISTIISAAGWASDSTFTKFHKKTPKSNFGASIIDNFINQKWLNLWRLIYTVVYSIPVICHIMH